VGDAKRIVVLVRATGGFIRVDGSSVVVARVAGVARRPFGVARVIGGRVVRVTTRAMVWVRVARKPEGVAIVVGTIARVAAGCWEGSQERTDCHWVGWGS
jgi:hypothetical protein